MITIVVKKGESNVYEYIKGTVEFIGPEYVVVEAGDIGYQLYTPNPFSFSPHEKSH